MTFSILEKFTCGKSLDGYSEDRVFSSNNHFGVLDGSRGPNDVGKDTITAILDKAVLFWKICLQTLDWTKSYRHWTN